MNNEMFYKIVGKPYLDIGVVSNNRIIERILTIDKGQRIVVSEKINRAFIIPDRNEGFKHKKKTVFYYNAENACPLTVDDISENNEEYEKNMLVLTQKNALLRLKNALFMPKMLKLVNDGKTKKSQKMEFIGTTIDSEVLRSIIHTKVVQELLKPNVNIWEALKLPIIIGMVGLFLLIFMYSV